MRRHPEPIRSALLTIFCWQRRKEIIDGLVDLLIQIVHKISVRAEKKVIEELVGELEKVDGKTTLLFRLAEAALERPEGAVKEVLFPVVGDRDLVGFGQGISFQGANLSTAGSSLGTPILQPSLPPDGSPDHGCFEISLQ